MVHADTDVDGPTEGVWRSRSLLSLGVRVLAIGGPVIAASLVGRLTLTLLPGHHGWGANGVALGVAVVVSLLLGKFAAKLLPLAVLLKMTMIFPDRAPNRAKVARRATSKSELARRLAHPDPDARETAATLLALVTALGHHDRKTRGHSERVRLYCDLVGEQLGLNNAERGRLRWVGLIHDIGKLEVAAEILNKPGKLSDAEWTSIRTHPHKGARLAEPLSDWLGSWFDGIEHHHERYDGSGYPNGHAGEQISLAGRAVSVVDAFETMTAARSYKSPMSTAAARAELTRCAGTHFDPVIVRAFLAISLPRLLWAMGPLTFLVNFPFLRWIPASSGRVADVAAASANTTVTAVGATAVTVAVVTSPVATTPLHAHHDHVHTRLAALDQSAHRQALPASPSVSTTAGPVGSTAGASPTAAASTTVGPATASRADSSTAPSPASSRPVNAVPTTPASPNPTPHGTAPGTSAAPPSDPIQPPVSSTQPGPEPTKPEPNPEKSKPIKPKPTKPAPKGNGGKQNGKNKGNGGGATNSGNGNSGKGKSGQSGSGSDTSGKDNSGKDNSGKGDPGKGKTKN